MAYSVHPGQTAQEQSDLGLTVSSLIWVYTFCTYLPVPIFEIFFTDMYCPIIAAMVMVAFLADEAKQGSLSVCSGLGGG